MLVCDAAAKFSIKEFNVLIKERNITLHITAIYSNAATDEVNESKVN